MTVFYHEKGRDPLYKIWNASEENMIIYFHSDGGSLVFENAVYPIEKGSICFVGSGKIHYTMPSDPSLYDRSKIFLSSEHTRALLGAVPPSSRFYRLFSENGAVYAKLPPTEEETAEKLFGGAKARCDGDDGGTAAAFFSLMVLISDYATHKIKTPDSFIARTIEYVNTAYSEDVSLDTLCRVASMSKSHFCRRFKETMGITVMEYVFQTRIAAAKSMLSSSEASISQISERCGFSSISYFCQKFKEEMGESAGAFRARAKNKKHE